MLSRIAHGLYTMGRAVERAQHVTRILEVNHKMSLQRAIGDEQEVWAAISSAFLCPIEEQTERALYDVLVLSSNHPFSVRRCVREARNEGRAMRDHISEEMWLHLNRNHLELKELSFEAILEMGRSEFNRRIEVFADALYGLADGTMIRGEAWAFLKIGLSMERAFMVCRILDIKRKAISPAQDGAPADVHHWQALLRSLSGYEPYRRAYDVRILPERVLAFVLQRRDFPRSLTYALREIRSCVEMMGGQNPLQAHLDHHLDALVDELRMLDADRVLHTGRLDPMLASVTDSCLEIADAIDLAYFTSFRPSSTPISIAPGASLQPQQ